MATYSQWYSEYSTSRLFCRCSSEDVLYDSQEECDTAAKDVKSLLTHHNPTLVEQADTSPHDNITDRVSSVPLQSNLGAAQGGVELELTDSLEERENEVIL